MEDLVSWRWTPTGVYTARSAYRMFFKGSTGFAGAKAIWKTWAPMKVKVFMWLGVHRRLWTADRRHRRGLQNGIECKLCANAVESANHLFCCCPFTQQVWQHISSILGMVNHPPNQGMSTGGFRKDRASTNCRRREWTRHSRWCLGRYGRKGTGGY